MDEATKDLKSRFIAERKSGLTDKQIRKLTSFQQDVRSLSPEQLKAFKKECEWQEIMKPSRPQDVNVGFGKSKTKVYMRCYWKNREMQNRIVEEYDKNIARQIREIKNQFSKIDLQDPDIQEFIAEAIREIKGR